MLLFKPILIDPTASSASISFHKSSYDNVVLSNGHGTQVAGEDMFGTINSLHPESKGYSKVVRFL